MKLVNRYYSEDEIEIVERERERERNNYGIINNRHGKGAIWCQRKCKKYGKNFMKYLIRQSNILTQNWKQDKKNYGSECHLENRVMAMLGTSYK